MLTGRTQTVGVLGTWAVGLASDVVTSKASTITGGTSVHVRRTCKPARHTLIDLLTDRLTLPSHTVGCVRFLRGFDRPRYPGIWFDVLLPAAGQVVVQAVSLVSAPLSLCRG
jgi:hypothetical protein